MWWEEAAGEKASSCGGEGVTMGHVSILIIIRDAVLYYRVLDSGLLHQTPCMDDFI